MKRNEMKKKKEKKLAGTEAVITVTKMIELRIISVIWGSTILRLAPKTGGSLGQVRTPTPPRRRPE